MPRTSSLLEDFKRLHAHASTCSHHNVVDTDGMIVAVLSSRLCASMCAPCQSYVAQGGYMHGDWHAPWDGLGRTLTMCESPQRIVRWQQGGSCYRVRPCVRHQKQNVCCITVDRHPAADRYGGQGWVIVKMGLAIALFLLSAIAPSLAVSDAVLHGRQVRPTASYDFLP